MKTQSPIYSFKFTISWIVIYIGIVFIMSRFLHLAPSIYLGLWLLNLLVEEKEFYENSNNSNDSNNNKGGGIKVNSGNNTNNNKGGDGNLELVPMRKLLLKQQ